MNIRILSIVIILFSYSGTILSAMKTDNDNITYMCGENKISVSKGMTRKDFDRLLPSVNRQSGILKNETYQICTCKVVNSLSLSVIFKPKDIPDNVFNNQYKYEVWLSENRKNVKYKSDDYVVGVGIPECLNESDIQRLLWLEKNFSIDQARNSVRQFINDVFGKKSPSKTIFKKYSSNKDIAESMLEEKYCHEKWGQPYYCDGNEIAIEKNCKIQMELWDRWPDKYQSLYYKRIRDQLFENDHIPEIKKIDVVDIEDPDNEYTAAYLVKAKLGKHDIEFRYPHADMMQDLNGWVSIYRINGNKFYELFPYPKGVESPECPKQQ